MQICLTTNQTCDCFEALTDPDSGCNWSATSLYSSAKTIKTQCSNTSEPGSYGACTSALKEAVTEVGKCGQSTNTTTTTTTSTTATTTPTTTTTTVLSIVVLNIIVRNSQNNTPVIGANINLNSTDGSVILGGFGTDINGTKSIEVPLAESYFVKISASGYIDETLQIDVNCTSDCQIDRYVSISPILLPEETRIRMTWQTEYPRDLDLHVLSVERSNQSNICLTFWGTINPLVNSPNCTEISLDLDNREGGLNGSETITLLNNTVNKDYVYIIAVEDFRFEDNGTLLLQSGVSVEINNNVKSVEQKLVASSVNYPEE